MRPYIISTDSMADLSKEYMETHKVQLHPLHYILDGVEYGAELETGEMDIVLTGAWEDNFKMFRGRQIRVSSAIVRGHVVVSCFIPASFFE